MPGRRNTLVDAVRFDAWRGLAYSIAMCRSGLSFAFVSLSFAMLGCSSDDGITEALPLTGTAGSAGASDRAPASFAPFVDPATGFVTDEVHDAEREVVRFDVANGAMVSSATGETVGGWVVSDTDLDWSRSSVPFRVRFGSEEGERRAYFTERGPGTICNLGFLGGGQLSISATGETPPGP